MQSQRSKYILLPFQTLIYYKNLILPKYFKHKQIDTIAFITSTTSYFNEYLSRLYH